MSPPRFEVRSYWEERLAADFSLGGVGHRRLGQRFNGWAYKARRERFRDVVRGLETDVARPRVLDVGSGTGFYIQVWEELGASDITGLDLTDHAVGQLQDAFPEHRFVRADIGRTFDELGLPAAHYDVISVMDVLFHVVDDDQYRNAISNLAELLAPGGRLIFSDLFVHHRSSRRAHRVSRSLTEVESQVKAAGLEVVSRVPFLVLMNDPADTRNLLYKGLWFAVGSLISRSERLGDFAGRNLLPLELRLARRRSESPSSEIMVVRRPAIADHGAHPSVAEPTAS